MIHGTERIQQYYGETRTTKLGTTSASLCHLNESATLADTNQRYVLYSESDHQEITYTAEQVSTVGDVPSNKEYHPLHCCILSTVDHLM